MKIFRLLALILGGILVLLGLAAGVLYALFDAEQVKTQLSERVEAATQRKLRIGGELQLSLWPDVGVKLSQVTLSEKGQDATFAAFDSARLAVAVMPLLDKKIDIRGIAIDGLRLNLRKNQDGSLNIDDLTGPKETPAKAAQPEQTVGPINIAGIELHHAQLSWQDAASGQTTTLSDLNLSSGRLRGDLANQRFHVEKLVLSTTGQRAGEQFDLALRAPLIEVDGERVSGSDIELSAKLAGPQRRLDAKLGLGGLGGSLKALRFARFSFDLAAQAGQTQLKAQLNSPLSLDAQGQVIQLEKITGQLDLSSPALPMQQLKLPLSGQLQADLKQQTAQLALATNFDETSLGLKLGLDHFSPLALQFELDADRLNIDKYLPPGKTGGSSPSGAPGASEESKIDLAALKGLNLQGRLNIGQLQVHQIKLAQLAAHLVARNGRLDIAPLSAKLYGGTVNGKIAVNANNNQFVLDQELSNIAIQPLLKDAIGKDPLEGKGSLSLNLNSQGQTTTALKKALAGQAALNLRDGAVKGINVAKTLRQLNAVLGQKSATQAADATEKTDFSSLAASFRITQGVAHNDDLEMKSPLLRLRGNGDIDIGQGHIDYLAKISIVNTATGQEGKELSRLKGVTVPLRLRGPFDKIGYTLELQSIAEEVVKEKAKEVIRKELKNQFKDLFGR